MEKTLITAIVAVWSALADWMIEYIPGFFTLFYSSESGLTLLGILAIAFTGIALVFLVIGLITNFFRLRS